MNQAKGGFAGHHNQTPPLFDLNIGSTFEQVRTQTLGNFGYGAHATRHHQHPRRAVRATGNSSTHIPPGMATQHTGIRFGLITPKLGLGLQISRHFNFQFGLPHLIGRPRSHQLDGIAITEQGPNRADGVD